MSDILKLTLLLAVVCALNGLALGLVYHVAQPAIEKASATTLDESLKLVLPAAARFSGRKECQIAGGRTLIYREGYDPAGGTVGYALSAARQGYQSVLKVLVGIDPRGVIQGVRVLAQAETPGLGARVDEIEVHRTLWGALASLVRGGQESAGDARPWFQEQYRGLSVSDLTLRRAADGGKGVHAITGATVTSRALTDAVRESLQGFLESVRGKA